MSNDAPPPGRGPGDRPDQPYDQNRPQYGQNDPYAAPQYGQNAPQYGQNAPQYGQSQYGQAYPSPMGAMPADQTQRPVPTTAPPSLRQSVKLMYAGAVLSLIGLIITLASRSKIHDAVLNANSKASTKLTPDQISAAVNVAYVSGIVIGIIGILLWLWMARANLAGKWWARIVATVLCVLCVLSVISSLSRSGATALAMVASIIEVLIALGATILLYRPDSAEFFKAHRAARG